MLGVLSAVNAGAPPARRGHRRHRDGVLPARARRAACSGPASASRSGCTSLFASALITGGVGPWMPYQMFGCAWVGLFAGLLPPCRGRREIAMLAAYGARRRLLLRASCSTCRSGRSRSTRDSSIAYLPGALVRRAVAPLPALRRHDLARLGHRPRRHQRHPHSPRRRRSPRRPQTCGEKGLLRRPRDLRTARPRARTGVTRGSPRPVAHAGSLIGRPRRSKTGRSRSTKLSQ